MTADGAASAHPTKAVRMRPPVRRPTARAAELAAEESMVLVVLSYLCIFHTFAIFGTSAHLHIASPMLGRMSRAQKTHQSCKAAAACCAFGVRKLLGRQSYFLPATCLRGLLHCCLSLPAEESAELQSGRQAARGAAGRARECHLSPTKMPLNYNPYGHSTHALAEAAVKRGPMVMLFLLVICT